ncbi:hypothetical protein SELMODRAFT_432360 [Selaginella moellendorffii]|uniref:Uncharacterized protein n=1 Tax=Selaginella moellendorffii TaxID=88036 RepID=D8TFS1_SELML|nr:hypothetical protein SELMODRAFT_432360 [Selaginella moellendorffii]
MEENQRPVQEARLLRASKAPDHNGTGRSGFQSKERGVRKKGLWQSRQERFQLQEKIQFISEVAVESSRTPGPGEHQDAEFQTNGPWITIKSRIPLRPKENFPGPGTYDVLSRPSSPSFSLGARHFVPEDKTENPWPGASQSPASTETRHPAREVPVPEPTSTRMEPSALVYQLSPSLARRRLHEKAIFQATPRLLHIEIFHGRSYAQRTSPSLTIYGLVKKNNEWNDFPLETRPGKVPVQKTSRSPGQGAYNVESGRSSPSFSIRGKISRERPHSPGPGAYFLPKTNQAPAFSLYGRIRGPRQDSFNSPAC